MVSSDSIELFTFGQYRNRPMAEVVRENPSYIVWAYTTVEGSGIPYDLYLEALPGARKAQAEHQAAKAREHASRGARRVRTAFWWDPNEDFVPREAREPEAVYFADGSGYVPGSGPAGPLYFDKFGNT